MGVAVAVYVSFIISVWYQQVQSRLQLVINTDSLQRNNMVETNKELPDVVVLTETPEKSVIQSLSFIDRFLSVWILSVMVIGVVVGYYSPETQSGLRRIEGE